MNRERSYTFARVMRIRGEREFDRVYKSGRRRAWKGFLVIALANECGHPRLGISVPRRFGGSVPRNRIKRRIREAFRLSQHELAAMDMLCVPQPGFEASVDELRKMLVASAAELAGDLDN